MLLIVLCPPKILIPFSPGDIWVPTQIILLVVAHRVQDGRSCHVDVKYADVVQARWGWWRFAEGEDIPSAQTGGEPGFSWQWECMNACLMKNNRVNSSVTMASQPWEKVSEKGHFIYVVLHSQIEQTRWSNCVCRVKVSSFLLTWNILMSSHYFEAAVSKYHNQLHLRYTNLQRRGPTADDSSYRHKNCE